MSDGQVSRIVLAVLGIGGLNGIFMIIKLEQILRAIRETPHDDK